MHHGVMDWGEGGFINHWWRLLPRALSLAGRPCQRCRGGPLGRGNAVLRLGRAESARSLWTLAASKPKTPGSWPRPEKVQNCPKQTSRNPEVSIIFPNSTPSGPPTTRAPLVGRPAPLGSQTLEANGPWRARWRGLEGATAGLHPSGGIRNAHFNRRPAGQREGPG